MIRRAALLVCVVILAASVQAGPRVALVIGNEHYANDPIPVAMNDATEIGDRLHDLDFDVVRCLDCPRDKMREKIAEFSAKLMKNGEAVIYYSGHGAQLGGENYLIPLGMTANDKPSFERGAVAVKEIYDQLWAKPQTFSLVILDACRENLLQRASFIGKDGLAKPQSNIYPAGSVTWFAANADTNAAKEHDRDHSPYTKAILKWLGEPGLSVQDMYLRVTDIVHNTFTHGQTPWTSSSQMATYLFRRPAYLDARIGQHDDDVLVAVASDIYDRNIDGPSKRLRLNPGENVLTVIVTNFNSKKGGVTPEGWSYGLSLEPVQGGSVPLRLFGCEPGDAPPPRSRFGTAFIAARAVVNVGATSGTISFGTVEPAVWRDGFSLIGRDEAASVDAAIRWALMRGGVFLYDRNGAGERRPLAALRTAFGNAHNVRHEEDGNCEPVGAHAAHEAAVAMLDALSDDELESAIERVRDAELIERRADVDENVRWALFEDPLVAEASANALVGGNRKMLRDLYWMRQEENPELRDLLHLVSDDELLAIIRRVRPA